MRYPILTKLRASAKDMPGVLDLIDRIQDQLVAAITPMLGNTLFAMARWRIAQDSTGRFAVQYLSTPPNTWTTIATLSSTATGFGAASPLTTKGDVWGYSTLDARLPVGTDAQVLTADSTQALGVKWSAAASGAPWSLATKPAVADVDDDEMEGATYTGWTAAGTPSLVNPLDFDTGFATATTFKYNWNAQRPGWALIQPSTDTSQQGFYKSIASLQTKDFFWTRWAAFAGPAAATNACAILALYDSVSGYYVVFFTNRLVLGSFTYLGNSGGGLWQFDQPYQNLITTAATAYYVQHHHYIGIRKNGSTYECWVGDNDGNWVKLAEHATTGFAPNQIQLKATNASAGAGVGFDFYRRRRDGSLP